MLDDIPELSDSPQRGGDEALAHTTRDTSPPPHLLGREVSSTGLSPLPGSRSPGSVVAPRRVGAAVADGSSVLGPRSGWQMVARAQLAAAVVGTGGAELPHVLPLEVLERKRPDVPQVPEGKETAPAPRRR